MHTKFEKYTLQGVHFRGQASFVMIAMTPVALTFDLVNSRTHHKQMHTMFKKDMLKGV